MTDPTKLFYGQIRPSNFEVLLDLYGHDPPWPMTRSPHLSLVDAVLKKYDARVTKYCEYLERTHGRMAHDTLRHQVALMEHLLAGGPQDPILTQHESILEGNHRTAVAIAKGIRITANTKAPYQTLEFPDCVVEGRRIGQREIPVDLKGKSVLDLGCADGMMSVTALRQGAAFVSSIDTDLCSTTWQLRKAWGLEDNMSITVERIETAKTFEDADVVLAMSVIQHIGLEAFTRHTKGRVCVFETHDQGQEPPPTHHWKLADRVSYSRAEPVRLRDIWIGTPLA